MEVDWKEIRTVILAIVAMITVVMPEAYGCSRYLGHLFWSPIIDSVNPDCSFAGIEPNPSGIVIWVIAGLAAFVVLVWLRRS